MRTLDRHRVVVIVALAIAVLLAARFLFLEQEPYTNTQTASVPRESATDVPTQLHSPSDVLMGRVIDAQTRIPITQFRVVLQSWDAPAAGAHEESSAATRTIGPMPFSGSRSGVFRVKGPPRGEWRMTILATNYEPLEARLLVADGEQRTTEPLSLRRGRSIKGRVFDAADGSGIPGATVLFRDAKRAGSHWRSPRSVRTLREGWFSVDGAPVGDLIINVQADGYAPRQIDLPSNNGSAQPVEFSMSALEASNQMAHHR